MKKLQQRALATVPLSGATVESFYDGSHSGTEKQCLRALCESHERLRNELQGCEILLEDTSNPNWKQRLRDFANDKEQHSISYDQWKTDRSHGVTLYCRNGFFTGYFDDATELWQRSEDGLPMYHVMVQSDRPQRTVIHAMHLAAWVQHLTGVCLPIQIMGTEDWES